MTTDAELDEKLARLAGRVQARSAATRALLADAGCLELAEAARETFGARLVHFRVGAHEQGTEPPQGAPFNFDLRPKHATPPLPAAHAPQTRKRKTRRAATPPREPAKTWHDLQEDR